VVRFSAFSLAESLKNGYLRRIILAIVKTKKMPGAAIHGEGQQEG